MGRGSQHLRKDRHPLTATYDTWADAAGRWVAGEQTYLQGRVLKLMGLEFRERTSVQNILRMKDWVLNGPFHRKWRLEHPGGSPFAPTLHRQTPERKLLEMGSNSRCLSCLEERLFLPGWWAVQTSSRVGGRCFGSFQWALAMAGYWNMYLLC